MFRRGYARLSVTMQVAENSARKGAWVSMRNRNVRVPLAVPHEITSSQQAFIFAYLHGERHPYRCDTPRPAEWFGCVCRGENVGLRKATQVPAPQIHVGFLCNHVMLHGLIPIESQLALYV